MRSLFPLALLLLLVTACTPEIPVKDDFGTSGLKPTGTIPPEFAAFNNYGPGVNPLLAGQICATTYIPLTALSAEAAPGEIAAATSRCRPFDLFGP
jgi:hypothetical protein